MTAYEIIKKKRDGLSLNASEIEAFINGYMRGEIRDYQMSAFLMAVYLNGMNDDETVAFTKAIADSGEKLDLSEFANLTVDKHSTGGVGDKTTLVVAPVAASLGCVVAKMSGRGLGFTGGTVDKLSSIPNYDINKKDFLSVVREVGVSVVGQSEKLTPADKKIYALRDVTATVESIPLIASSIMSKKIATGSHSIVLDVKFGSGAFMKDKDSALMLAEKMINIGKNCGRKMAAILTDMDKPLGYAIGNNLEVIEAVKLLKGERIPDLYDECVSLASTMVSLAKGISTDKAELLVKQSLKSGLAYTKFKEWISAQGGDISYIDNTDKFEKAMFVKDVYAENSGYISEMNTEIIGMCAGMLGAGRQTAEDDIDYSAGIILNKKTGDFVSKGDKLCTLYTNREKVISDVEIKYLSAVKLSEVKPEPVQTVYRILF